MFKFIGPLQELHLGQIGMITHWLITQEIMCDVIIRKSIINSQRNQ